MVATFPCRHQTGMWSIGLVHELALMRFNHSPVIALMVSGFCIPSRKGHEVIDS